MRPKNRIGSRRSRCQSGNQCLSAAPCPASAVVPWEHREIMLGQSATGDITLDVAPTDDARMSRERLGVVILPRFI